MPRLAEHTHLVAIDLPGFGHSQRRDALLSPRAMAEFVVRAADAFALDHPHLVGPGTGTVAVLFAAVAYPDRLRSLVVGSGTAGQRRVPGPAAAPQSAGHHRRGPLRLGRRPAEYAALITSWWVGRYKTATRTPVGY